MKNKRGEIPTVILVIGIFAVCTLALITFYLSQIYTKGLFVGLDTMQEMNVKIENASFNGLSANNFYLEKKNSEREKWYSLEETEKVVFSVKYNSP
jgi:hypothetical protein